MVSLLWLGNRLPSSQTPAAKMALNPICTHSAAASSAERGSRLPASSRISSVSVP